MFPAAARSGVGSALRLRAAVTSIVRLSGVRLQGAVLQSVFVLGPIAHSTARFRVFAHPRFVHRLAGFVACVGYLVAVVPASLPLGAALPDVASLAAAPALRGLSGDYFDDQTPTFAWSDAALRVFFAPRAIVHSVGPFHVAEPLNVVLRFFALRYAAFRAFAALLVTFAPIEPQPVADFAKLVFLGHQDARHLPARSCVFATLPALIRAFASPHAALRVFSALLITVHSDARFQHFAALTVLSQPKYWSLCPIWHFADLDVFALATLLQGVAFHHAVLVIVLLNAGLPSVALGVAHLPLATAPHFWLWPDRLPR